MNFRYRGLEARIGSTTERKSWAVSKSGGPKYQLMVTGMKCMCGDVELVDKKGWLWLMIVLVWTKKIKRKDGKTKN